MPVERVQHSNVTAVSPERSRADAVVRNWLVPFRVMYPASLSVTVVLARSCPLPETS